jgi:hypothetical protein
MANKCLWAGLAIAVMWLAVIFVGLYGPSFEVTRGADVVSVPTVWMVAFFAAVATIFVGNTGFRS